MEEGISWGKFSKVHTRPKTQDQSMGQFNCVIMALYKSKNKNQELRPKIQAQGTKTVAIVGDKNSTNNTQYLKIIFLLSAERLLNRCPIPF